MVVVESTAAVDGAADEEVAVDGDVDDDVEASGEPAVVGVGSVDEHATDIVASMQIPNPVSFFRNWTRSDLTTEEKLRQAVKNTAIKARTGDSCCGNHGEVGC